MALFVKNELETARASTVDPITKTSSRRRFHQHLGERSSGRHGLSRRCRLSLFSRKASRVEVLLFDREDDASPARVISIDPATNRTYHYWHIFVPNLQPGQIYGYRIDGPVDPAKVLRPLRPECGRPYKLRP
jgi:pullulanase/glycogen debranching enzyme